MAFYLGFLVPLMRTGQINLKCYDNVTKQLEKEDNEHLKPIFKSGLLGVVGYQGSTDQIFIKIEGGFNFLSFVTKLFTQHNMGHITIGCGYQLNNRLLFSVIAGLGLLRIPKVIAESDRSNYALVEKPGSLVAVALPTVFYFFHGLLGIDAKYRIKKNFYATIALMSEWSFKEKTEMYGFLRMEDEDTQFGPKTLGAGVLRVKGLDEVDIRESKISISPSFGVNLGFVYDWGSE